VLLTQPPARTAIAPAGRSAVPRTASYVAAGVEGDLAYTVAIERGPVRLAGAAGSCPMTLRVTHVFRCERGEWTLIDRRVEPFTPPGT
jgi:hypothetical protein